MSSQFGKHFVKKSSDTETSVNTLLTFKSKIKSKSKIQAFSRYLYQKQVFIITLNTGVQSQIQALLKDFPGAFSECMFFITLNQMLLC